MLVLELLIILFLFLGPAIFAMFGWSTIDSTGSMFQSVHPIIYLLIAYMLVNFSEFKKKKIYLYNTVAVITIIFLFRVLFEQYVISRLAGNLLIPLLFSFYIERVSKKAKSRTYCSQFFILLLFSEIGLAVYERLTKTLIFPWSLYSPEDLNGTANGGDYFRSNSLLGHPLANALCVSIVMSFIAVSSIKSINKYILLISCFIAILCFNARFAIVISFVFYFGYYFLKNKMRPGTFITLGLVSLIIFALISSLNLGDRLLSNGLDSEDTSILARFDIFDMLGYLNYDLIYRGSGLEFVSKALGMLHIENWLLIMIFDLGLITTVYYVCIVYKLSFRSLARFSKGDKLYIFAAFIIIASSNNSLATEVPALSFLMASSVLLPYQKQHENVTNPPLNSNNV
jgi:hypothetical protein